MSSNKLYRLLKTLLSSLVLIFCFMLHTPHESKAAHISGGELFYRYLGPGTAPNSARYQVSLRLFRDCNPIAGGGGVQTADLPTLIVLGVFNSRTSARVIDSLPVTRTEFSEITLQNPGVCIRNAPPVCYQIGTYTQTIELPINAEGYTVSFQTCCRTNGLSNVSGFNAGATYLANIPGTLDVGNVPNSSPVFDIRDTVLVCRNRRFSLPFSAIDPDGDSLSYRFCEAYNSVGITNAAIRKPFAPPYTAIAYQNNYSGLFPLGAGVSIRPQNGLIEGLAPDGIINLAGISYFVVNVCVTEWRSGIAISEHRKDFLIRISPCDIAQATLRIDERGCDTYTKTFVNLTNSSQIQSWFWDFGVPNRLNDTSNLISPTYTFPDTGTYRVKLIVNKESICADSAFSTYYIYPGFFPDIKFKESCKNQPIEFEDGTISNFGAPNSWFWDFGVNNSLTDTSILKNPQYTYTNTGNYTVRLIVGSNKGCLDTINKVIAMPDRPSINLTNDTTICLNDLLPLTGTGNGTWSWSPNINISNANISNPVVSPDTTTTYYATLTNSPGCFSTDSVKVVVKKFVLLLPLTDTTICLGDTIQINPVSDGLKFSWTPASNVLNPNEKNARILAPPGTTTFNLKATIGGCDNTANFIIRTVPYPIVRAGNDTSVCFNDIAILNGTGTATQWQWTPASIVTNSSQPITQARPLSTQNFILQGTGNNGCPKPVRDTVNVRVVPPVVANAGNDTVVVAGQQLKLNGTGGKNYQWSPPAYLNNASISNPVAVFDRQQETFRYILTASTPEGCKDTDTILIKIFKTDPGFFVPSAFTPDNNGLNDLFKPVAVGMATFDFFKVYNRWGNEVFSTNIAGKGWDGTFKGQLQEAGLFVWIVQGTDFTGKKHFQKGTVTLLR
jgi:gliding motility-associated-like protein